MAGCVEGLRNLVLGEIESISRSLLIAVGPSQIIDVQEALEKTGQIVNALNCLDFVTRLSEDVNHDLSRGKKIIERSSATSARTPRVNIWIYT